MEIDYWRLMLSACARDRIVTILRLICVAT